MDDLARVKELIELMNRHRLGEVEIEQDGVRIRLAKQSDRQEVVAIPGAGLAAGAPAGIGAVPAAAEVEAGDVIKSPLVGTFYRAANPNADAFVEVGDHVEEGRVLCIVEAMKVMNEVKAEASGTITEAFVENGESVEFGQPLFRLA